jgi:GNAT superfamily N-acetyltransferase
VDTDFTIREMSPADVDQLLELFDKVAAERLWIGTEPGFDRDHYRDIFGRGIGMRNAMFVAERSGRVIAGLTTFEHVEYGWTIGMMVDEPERGKGIGRALLERLFTWAENRGISHLSLLVFPHNERALRLYRSTGFTEVERYENDVRRKTGDVWDTILMRKTLA